MARRPMMAANWKMNKLVGEAQEYVEGLLPRIKGAEGVDVAIFAPFTSLGEDVGAGAVIVGHSERREIFGEANGMVGRKAARAVSAGLLPVVCVGETKEERDAGSMWEKVSRQVRAVFEHLDTGEVSGGAIVFAYEPIWAIGTG